MKRTRFYRGTRGVSVVIMAVFLVVLMGMAALAIDLGMLQKTRAEAQRAADAAALAGASAYLLDMGVHAETLEAGHRARQVADTNYMAGTKIDSLTELTVWAIPDSQKVRVLVRRASVPTWFARVFGKDAFAVGAKAAAVAEPSGGTSCIKPLTVPDAWVDASDLSANGGDNNGVPSGSEDWVWDGSPPDEYMRYSDPRTSAQTGFFSSRRNGDGIVNDVGRQLILRAMNGPAPETYTYETCVDDQGNKCLLPGWWGLWGPTPNPQPQDLENWLLPPSLGGTCIEASIATAYDTKPGVVGAVTNKALEDILGADPGARWSTDTVTGSTYGVNWRSKSERVWIMAVFEPGLTPPKANDKVTFNNFALFFFEGCADNKGNINYAKCKANDDIVGRFLGLAPGTKPGAGTLLRMLRLVE